MPEPIGGIQPFAELARGRATVVYKGYQRDPGRFVLLKVVRPEGGEDGGLVERFEEEARLAARVRHPNVVAVLDAGRDGLGAFLVTEFVEGLDLRALLERGALPAALAAYVLAEAARGLAAVHAQGILHRDLKPANLLISEDGEVKLADFGFASLAPVGGDPGSGFGAGSEVPAEVRGTLAYLAPELVRGDSPSRAADLFSLGVLLAEMLTGRSAFARTDDGATLDAVLHHDPITALAADPRVPPSLADLAGRLLAKDPQRRLADATELADELAAIRTEYPADAADLAAFLRDPTSYVPPQLVVPSEKEADSSEPDARVQTSSPRRRVWWGVAAAVVAASIGIAAMLSSLEQRDDVSQEVALLDPVGSVRPDSVISLDVPPVMPDDSLAVAEQTTAAREPAAATPPPDDAGSDLVALEREGGPIGEQDPEPPATLPADPRAEVAGLVAEPVYGTLIVAAEPWAHVRVDGEPVGTTPLAALTLPAGAHTVAFENPEFPAHTVRVEVGAGEEERVAVSLWSLVGRVELVVSPWAEVAVDGLVWDTVPPQQRPLVLAPGEHRLTFSHPTLGTREVPLRIAAGESRTVRVNLADRLP